MKRRKTEQLKHAWDLTPTEAIALQRKLCKRIDIPESTTVPPIKTVAGADCSFSSDGRFGYAAIVVFSYPGLKEIQRTGRRTKVTFPYVPGLLSFREAPLVIAALEKLPELPDLLIVDGHGLAHPRRFGIACHIGLLIDRPTIGCGKSRLVGSYRMPGQRTGSTTALMHQEEEIGRALRTRRGCKPVFVSVGHRIGLTAATRVITQCVQTYRIPTPTRIADRFCAQLRETTRA